MKTVPLDLGTGSSPGADGQEGRTRHINGFVEALGGEAKSQRAIYPVAGLSRWDRGAYTGGARGLIKRSDNELIAFLGQQIVSFDTNANATVLGALAGTKRLFLALNQALTPEIAIVDGDGLYYLLTSSTITQILSPNLPNPNSVCYLDGRFIFGIDDGRFFLSNILDGATILADASASAESRSDSLVRVFSHKGYLYLLGAMGTEIWQDAGLAGSQPYEPVERNIESGLIAPHSVAETATSIIWIDQRCQVVRQTNGLPERISSHSVERAIESLTPAQQSAIWGSVHWYGGHEMYTLVSDAWTWEFDSLTNLWHERKSQNLSRWRANAHTWFGGRHILGDYLTGALYALSKAVYDEDGQPLTMEVWCPPMSQFPGGMKIAGVDLDLLAGQGLNVSDVAAQYPAVMMSYSEDGGRTWSNELIGATGAIGEYDTRVKWPPQGACRHKSRIFRFAMSAAVRRGFLQATVRGEALR
jgi:hypothetical protein